MGLYRKHIFQDLKPYVCTFEECDLKMFADRNTWFSHELQVHRIEWCCPFCSHSPLKSLESFEGHLLDRHAQNITKEQLSALSTTCQQSVDKISPQACPFCDEWSVKLSDANPMLAGEALVVTPAQFQHHVGSHMEQLALFALPKDHGDAVESTGVAGADNRANSELGSRASYESPDNPPLHIAAYEGLEAEVFQLLKDGAKVNAPGQTWGNVLQAAVVGGHVSIVQLLLEYGAEVTLYGGPYGQYSLHTAMQTGKEEMVRLLLEVREKTELKSDEEIKSIYYEHEGREKQGPLKGDTSLDLETRYQIALRYPRTGYTCPLCGEESGDANQLWSQHAASMHLHSLGPMRPGHSIENEKRFIVLAERFSSSQKGTQTGATNGSDTVLLIDSIISISTKAQEYMQALLSTDLALRSDTTNVASQLTHFIITLAKTRLQAQKGRFSGHLRLERDLKLLLQNLRKRLEVFFLTLDTVTMTDANGRVRIKPPDDSTEFERMCFHSVASQFHVWMELLGSTLLKFPATPGPSADSLEKSQSKVTQPADNAGNPENTNDTEGAGKAEAEGVDGTLASHIKFVIEKAKRIELRVRMVHHSEAPKSSNAIRNILHDLPQIISLLLETYDQLALGTYTLSSDAPLGTLLDKLRPILVDVESLFGSNDQRQARMSPNDPQAEEVLRVSSMIEIILNDFRNHEHEISVVSGLKDSVAGSPEPKADFDDGWGSFSKVDKKKGTKIKNKGGDTDSVEHEISVVSGLKDPVASSPEPEADSDFGWVSFGKKDKKKDTKMRNKGEIQMVSNTKYL